MEIHVSWGSQGIPEDDLIKNIGLILDTRVEVIADEL
jgi:hypothetical protein